LRVVPWRFTSPPAPCNPFLPRPGALFTCALGSQAC
jgi:hypothetical protein